MPFGPVGGRCSCRTEIDIFNQQIGGDDRITTGQLLEHRAIVAYA